MANTDQANLSRVWEWVAFGGDGVNGTISLELGRAGGEIEYFISDSDSELEPDDEGDYPCHRLNSDRPVAVWYQMATFYVWARSPSTLVESTELIFTVT